MDNIQKQLESWADKHVERFNQLSEIYKTPFYTQSPLNVISEDIDLMIVGINPKGELGTGACKLTSDEYLRGNQDWTNRFQNDGTVSPNWGGKHRFLSCVHTFLGYDNFYHPESIDNDKRTVWTNLTPFVSNEGNKDVYKELMTTGIKSTLELISIIRPTHIILLGINAFDQFDKYCENASKLVQYNKVFPSLDYQIGRICGVPATCVAHPSSTKWALSSHYFTSMFIFMHRMLEITNIRGKRRSLDEVSNLMKIEFEKIKAL